MEVDIISLMERISAAEDVILYDERGSDQPLQPEEIDLILTVLAKHATGVTT